MLTLRLLLAARDGCDDALEQALGEEAARAAGLLGAGARATVLRRIEDDPFAAQYPTPRAFDAVLALDLPAGDERADRLIDCVRQADQRLDRWVQPDVSGAIVARRIRLVGGEGPLRFVYLMRHRAGSTTAAFQEHWGGPHAEFGRRTGGIAGYDQLHVDRGAARAAARLAGFAVHAIDGAPELHLRSVGEFVSAAVGSETGDAAIEDERSFVDGRNSVGFVCRVVGHHGEGAS